MSSSLKAPCQEGGQWFGEEDIQLLFAHKGHQRIYASLMIKARKESEVKSEMTYYSKQNLQGKTLRAIRRIRRSKKEDKAYQEILTITVVAVSWRKFDSHNLL